MIEFTKEELDVIKDAVGHLECSACTFEYVCDKKDDYGPCDLVIQKINKFLGD